MSFRWRLGGLPVLWQTLAVLLASLLVTQAVGLGILFLVPPPRPDFARLSDVAAVLRGQAVDMEGREAALLEHLQPGAPERPRGLLAEPVVTHELAERLKAPDTAVRFYFEPDAKPGFMFRRRSSPSWPRRHEPIFFGRVRAGLLTPQGWRIIDTAPRPFLSPWQRRMIAWFAIGALALVPIAWLFARAISRQIGRFAEAADRVGADAQAPAVAEWGAAELRVAARALNRMQERLAEHVSERTAMIGAIAHDLRTPLARIAFRVEGAPEPTREKVLADVAQMQAMISATIGFVRSTQERGSLVPVDLAGLVTAIVEQDRDLGRAVTPGEIDAATVLGDPLSLERLIQNLIDNGLAYGGAVDASLIADATTVTLRIADRGPGLAPDLLERVFQPFVRGDPSRNRDTGGIGLGLTIARTIAKEHGGSVTLANRPGGGLEALVRLPRA
ncbi:ATP-binding protein [Sphingomonas nostoxanthinifaciens]|uniref:ATP-binding protein n=1 Tax=Sphingomonas nostoxanthinifaciens TaxID=2872652 RepID=UPI001CC21348|nr:ATP-binding protein [Sphingomonas nostoxanthinifaciens]UAK23472.1 HAMP domain-containing protein [Sphingomonas nostoxanthinifaciens]